MNSLTQHLYAYTNPSEYGKTNFILLFSDGNYYRSTLIQLTYPNTPNKSRIPNFENGFELNAYAMNEWIRDSLKIDF